MNDDLPVELLAAPAVRAFVAALNTQDKEAFEAALAPGATMSDDGNERDLAEWTEREIFSSGGHMDVESQSDDGLTLVARYRNDTWGEMRTSWVFTVEGGKVARFETGQA
ncbi:nuclear transport factor 2 family protein [Streptomyces boluensis]|uniref:Nuclear transport factor 2 family protein n=1 Tax=Streptomyces boluensis TaxID=1775135 RepID=A0A964XP61_9ACTN|nr:nuclear transport factor 2 family protein [Streptomyces boluensis]NBE54906.1 nuclear transport factor 2 family protein [Streptomyces boluensis]